ncbi:hypothetical protein [Rubritalea marina]|uniref:hypothetical protein n=1 Tax=Rubritalea marina TaxID=361055 RepID=UPI00036FAAD8|nr:hypothetical protein [Rubritalea marina]
MTAPIESSFEKLLVLLVKNSIKFTTVDGIAVCLNGYVRLTEDVDILIAKDKSNIEKLIEALSGFGEGFASELEVGDFTDEEGAIRIIESVENCQINIFVRMRGLHLEDFREDIQYFEAGDTTEIPYLGSKSLIQLKSGTVREKDRVDVSVLESMGEQ